MESIRAGLPAAMMLKGELGKRASDGYIYFASGDYPETKADKMAKILAGIS